MPRAHAISPFAEGLTDQLYSPLSARAAASGRTVHPLHVGDTWREPCEGALRAAHAPRPGTYTYAPVQGEPALRRAFADHQRAAHGIELDADTLQVTAGATSGVAVAVHTLLDAGDEVLLPAPYWPLVRGVFASRGVVPVEIPFFDRLVDPSFDVEAELERRITPRTAALYVNSPNNPTGASLSRDQLDAVARVVVRHDLWVFSDEAYCDLAWSGAAEPTYRHPALVDRSVVFHTLSKSHGLAGARIGFLHGPDRVMRALRGMQMHFAYCAPRPMQASAVAALRDGSGWTTETRRLYRDAAHATARVFDVPAPNAGTFLFVDVSRWLPDGARDCTRFLEACADRGVLLTPGDVSGSDYARWVRVCFTSVAPPVLEAALDAIAEVLRG